MGWLSSKADAAAPQGWLSGLVATSGNEAVYPGGGFLSYANAGFARNELVYACIMEKATSAPEAPLRVYGPDGLGDPRENHPLRELISNPNPILSEYELFELTIIHLDLAGIAAWEVVRDRAGRPSELWPLRPDLLRFTVDRSGRVHYAYLVGSGAVPLGEVISFKYPNPIDPYVGMPPLRPAVRAVALDNEATNFVTALLQNKAVPGTVITTQQAIDETQAERLKARWKEAFGGRNRGEPVVFQAGMDAKAFGLDLEKLEFPDLRTISEARICSAFGVPPILVGAKVGLDRSTFANYGEARRSFWEETLMPLQRRLRDRIVTDLLPLVQTDGRPRRVTVRFDRSEVLALQESEQARWERATQALRAGAITVTDFRRAVGMPPIPGTDVFLRPAGVIPTDAQGVPVNGTALNEAPKAAPIKDMNDDQLNAFMQAGEQSIRESREPREVEA